MENSNRANWKLVDTWFYEYQGVEIGALAPAPTADVQRASADAVKVPVKLYLNKRFKGSIEPPREVKEAWFSLVCENPKFSIAGSDIDALRCGMWDYLDERFAVKWELYYKVRIGKPYTTCGLTFEYEFVEKGTAWNGALLLREFEHGAQRVIRPWPGEFLDNQGKVMACIPATPENKRALTQFDARIVALRQRLADFLRPDVILQTLADLGGIAFLPEPAQTDFDEPSSGPPEAEPVTGV